MRTIQTVLWTLVILVQMSVVKCLEVRAETASGTGISPEITITYGFQESPDDCVRPEEFYEDEDGIRYELESWSPVSVTFPSITRRVEEEIVYNQAEGVTEIPETIEVQAEDRERRQTVNTVCRMEAQEVIQEAWEDGFVFTVTFHTYEAGYYQLGDRLIPYNDEVPELEGCGDLLLELAGLSPEDYRVTYVRWSGEAYRDEDGSLCRDAAAFGQRRLRDYRVRYRGTAVFPARKGWQTAAVYRLPEYAATEAEAETGDMEASASAGIPETEAQTGLAEPERQPLTLWERITRTFMVAVAVGAVLFLGGLLILAILRVVKKLRSCYNRRKMKSSGG